MHSIARPKILRVGSAFLRAAASVALALGMLVPASSVSVAQVADVDKVRIEKFGALVSGNVEFTIRVTTVSAHQIDDVRVTDNLPNSGITWSLVSSDPTCSISGAVGSQVLNCNFGTLDATAGVQTRTARVRGVLSAGRCGDIENTATVRVAAAEGETVLSNNTATAKVTVACAGTNITPTGTTCEQFRAGTAADLTQVIYNVRSSGNIGNVAPGIFFYFVSVPGGGTYHILQSDTGSTPAFGVSSIQVYTRSDCERYRNITVNTSNLADVTVTLNGDAAGQQFIIRLAADPNTVNGSPAPSPSTVVYTYTTTGVSNSTDSVNLVRNN